MLEGVLASVLNRFLSAYVENLNLSQLNVGIWSGDVKLRNLRLKKEALDKFHLPIDVAEGYLGELTLSIPWSNLKGSPVRVLIDNVYLLAVPKGSNAVNLNGSVGGVGMEDEEWDEEEEQSREYRAKMEKLENAELLASAGKGGLSAEEESKNQSFISSLVTKIIDNVQITVRNIHLRYEDRLSNPQHPFSAGVTLAEFSAVSTDADWNPTFITDTTETIHKLAKLESLAAYWDTDSVSLSGYSIEEAITKFTELIARGDHQPNHQFILRPVTGVGRLHLRHKIDSIKPKTDVQLLFDELGFVLDDEQYRDALSVVDLFHFYHRRNQYRKFRPTRAELEENRPAAMFRFAAKAILNEVHEKHRKWSWAYFAERRDDRKAYVEVFKMKLRANEAHNQQQAGVEPVASDHDPRLKELEMKLSFRDIRFYRSIARSELRKERAASRQSKTEDAKEDHQKPTSSGGWLGWLWGSGETDGGESQGDGAEQSGVLSDQQRKELYDAIEWDESEAIAQAVDLPRDALKLRLGAKLNTGSFALRSHQTDSDILSLVFDALSGDALQRTDNLEAMVSIGGLRVYDGVTKNTQHPQIVRVKEEESSVGGRENTPTEGEHDERAAEEVKRESDPEKPFFLVKFEKNPLDNRADSALTVKMRHTEVIYHRGYVEAVMRFFKPPQSELELIGALIDVASETLDGMRKETRAGLENALQTHKTIDLEVDIKAPIIIAPEDVTKRRCQHMVLDAGHIAVKSDLVNQSEINTIRSKQNQQYSEEDYKQLESLMYDKFFVQLKSAQLVMGNDLQSCLEGLTSDSTDHGLHLIERINVDFLLQNCILPEAPNLTKFKVSGHLPHLHVNFSDRKYKTLMRIIDVAIPHVDEAPGEGHIVTEANLRKGKGALDLNRERRQRIAEQLKGEPALAVDTSDAGSDVGDEPEEGAKDDSFVETASSNADKANLNQKTFELNFTVDKLQASIFKSSFDFSKPDRLLVDTLLQGFFLDLAVYPFRMEVDVRLRSLVAEDKMVEQDVAFRHIISSDETEASRMGSPNDLIRVKYSRVQTDHPEYMSKFEGIDQSVDAAFSTINVIMTRVSTLMLFDWIVTTFVPNNEPLEEGGGADAQDEESTHEGPSNKIQVKVKLTGINLKLNNDGILLATLSLNMADVAVMVNAGRLRVGGRLGDLSLIDNLERAPEFTQMLSIQGDELADFSYETFDVADDQTYPGYDSSLWLRSGSLRFTFVEDAIHDIIQFFSKFARMKALYDAASAAAANRASGLQDRVDKMHFDILVKTPIVVLPRQAGSRDVIEAHLGELFARNTFPSQNELEILTKIEAGLRQISLTSKMQVGSESYSLKMIDDVNVSVDVTQATHVGNEDPWNEADTQVTASISDIHMKLTEQQYGLLIGLAQSIPQAFVIDTGDDDIQEALTPVQMSTPATPVEGSESVPSVDLLPELGKVGHEDDRDVPLRTALTLQVRVGMVDLELFTAAGFAEQNLRQASLARFSINETGVRFKMLSDSAMEADIGVKSFTLTDTRPHVATKFRDIIPAVDHGGDQLSVTYTMSGGSEKSALALVTVDRPKVIFSLDPLFGLLEFAISPFKSGSPQNATDEDAQRNADGDKDVDDAEDTGAPGFAFRVNVIGPTIILLAHPDRSDSEAIVLSIKQVLMSQQGIMALKVDQLGMFLCLMNKPKETVRLLDNMDFTMSLDSRATREQHITSIEVDADSIVLRASYRDILLISSIANKAIELSSKTKDESSNDVVKPPRGNCASSRGLMAPTGRIPARPTRSSWKKSASKSSREQSLPNVREASATGGPLAKEVMKAHLGGLQVILIGDVHGLPLLDASTHDVKVEVTDWSKNMRVGITADVFLNYFNLSRSHWEPVVDPWNFKIEMEKKAVTGTTAVTFSSRKRLELNVTSTLIETGLTYASLLNKESEDFQERSRGEVSPFLIRNQTGYDISVWSEGEEAKHRHNSVRIENGGETPWRFNDWHSMREHAMSHTAHSLSLHIDGMPWERVKHISVEREGEYIFSLRPKIDNILHKILCEVRLRKDVKVITFRSTLRIENRTLVPIEAAVLDEKGKVSTNVHKIAPGEDFPVPIETAYHDRVRLRPDPGFGYLWSTQSLHWQDMLKQRTRSLTCQSDQANEAPFRFQAFAIFDAADPTTRAYPKMTIRLRAPIELENLLPYPIRYRVYDKNENRNWSSYIRTGGVSPVHVTDLSHLVLCSVEVQDQKAFGPSEFAIVNSQDDDFPVEKTLKLKDTEDRVLELRINYVEYAESGGAFKAQIFSPYVFYNKTGLDFTLKTKSFMSRANLAAGQEALGVPQQRKEPVPFMFSHRSRDRRNRFLLRIGDSEWSKPLSFETVGSETAVIVPSSSKNEEYHTGLTVNEGLGKFNLTKVISLAPRYMIKNNTSEPINIREFGSTDPLQVGAGERRPLHSLRIRGPKQLVIAYPGLNNKWSAPFNMEDIGQVHLRLAKAGHHQHLIRVDVLLEGPTIFMTLTREEGSWPFLLRNESDHTIFFCQTTDSSMVEDAEDFESKKYELKPRSKMKYAWDYPAMRSKLIRLFVNGRKRDVDIMEIGALKPFSFQVEGGYRTVALDVRADGPTQTLVISNYDESQSVFKPRRGPLSLSRSNTVSSQKTVMDFESMEQDTKLVFSFNVELEGVGISLINKRMQELAYISFRGLEFHYIETDVTMAFDVICKWIQVDNQLFGGLFPIVMYPSVLPKEGKELEGHPTLQASLIRLKDESHGVTHIKYASVLLQEITFELDEDFMFSMYDFSKVEGVSWEEKTSDKLIEHPTDIPEPTKPAAGSGDIYFEILHLQPILLHLSFMRTERVNAEEKVNMRNPVLFVINALTMAIGNVNDAQVQVNALVVENVRLSPPDLEERILIHFTQNFIQQFYRVIGSADFLGNPVGLFNNVSSGVADIFYEPYQGLVMHGHKELGSSLARGATSFVKKTVFGLTDSFSKVTASIGKGLAAATMDREFQSRRRMTRIRNRPKHALYGVAAGANSFVTSVASGFEGLALKPIEGAEQGGAGGFFKGVGKGLVGAVTKPVVGMFDLASNVSEGMRNTAGESNDLDRARLPRFIAADGILRPYSQREALGQSWLKNLDNGKYLKDTYVAHLAMPDPDKAVLLTTSRILLIRPAKLRTEWEVPLADLQTISMESNGIALVLRGGVAGPFLAIGNAQERAWFFKHIERVVRAYNSQRRAVE